MGPDRINSLTPRQLACLRKAAEFKSSKIIAHEMGITSKTVDRHIEAANRTLGVGSRQQAVRLLLQKNQLGGFSPEVFSRIDVPSLSGTFPEHQIESVRLRDGDEREIFQTPAPVPREPLSEPGEDACHDLIDALRTVALIIVIAATFVLLIAHYPALIAAAEALAATLQTYRPT